MDSPSTDDERKSEDPTAVTPSELAVALSAAETGTDTFSEYFGKTFVNGNVSYFRNQVAQHGCLRVLENIGNGALGAKAAAVARNAARPFVQGFERVLDRTGKDIETKSAAFVDFLVGPTKPGQQRPSLLDVIGTLRKRATEARSWMSGVIDDVDSFFSSIAEATISHEVARIQTSQIEGSVDIHSGAIAQMTVNFGDPMYPYICLFCTTHAAYRLNRTMFAMASVVGEAEGQGGQVDELGAALAVSKSFPVLSGMMTYTADTRVLGCIQNSASTMLTITPLKSGVSSIDFISDTYLDDGVWAITDSSFGDAIDGRYPAVLLVREFCTPIGAPAGIASSDLDISALLHGASSVQLAQSPINVTNFGFVYDTTPSPCFKFVYGVQSGGTTQVKNARIAGLPRKNSQGKLVYGVYARLTATALEFVYPSSGSIAMAASVPLNGATVMRVTGDGFLFLKGSDVVARWPAAPKATPGFRVKLNAHTTMHPGIVDAISSAVTSKSALSIYGPYDPVYLDISAPSITPGATSADIVGALELHGMARIMKTLVSGYSLIVDKLDSPFSLMRLLTKQMQEDAGLASYVSEKSVLSFPNDRASNLGIIASDIASLGTSGVSEIYRTKRGVWVNFEGDADILHWNEYTSTTKRVHSLPRNGTMYFLSDTAEVGIPVRPESYAHMPTLREADYSGECVVSISEFPGTEVSGTNDIIAPLSIKGLPYLFTSLTVASSSSGLSISQLSPAGYDPTSSLT